MIADHTLNVALLIRIRTALQRNCNGSERKMKSMRLRGMFQNKY